MTTIEAEMEDMEEMWRGCKCSLCNGHSSGEVANLRAQWVIALADSGLSVELIVVGNLMAAYADPETGGGISMAREQVAGKLRLPRSRINAAIAELRELGWVERSSEPRRTRDEHRLVVPVR